MLRLERLIFNEPKRTLSGMLGLKEPTYQRTMSDILEANKERRAKEYQERKQVYDRLYNFCIKSYDMPLKWEVKNEIKNR